MTTPLLDVARGTASPGGALPGQSTTQSSLLRRTSPIRPSPQLMKARAS
jgi:hypothetical protein